MIKKIREYARTEEGKIEVVLISDTAPAGTITGADVDGVEDDLIIQAGSVLITPSANYIAFSDGVFTKKV